MPRKKSSTKKAANKTLEEYTETLVDPDEREKMIAEAAYYRAEQHGFDPTCVEDDWYEAEKYIDDKLFKEVEEAVEH